MTVYRHSMSGPPSGPLGGSKLEKARSVRKAQEQANQQGAAKTNWRFRILWLVLAAALVFVQGDPALAHSPVFSEEHHSIATAYWIADPPKSWAVYAQLEHENSGDYYSFELRKGDRI